MSTPAPSPSESCGVNVLAIDTCGPALGLALSTRDFRLLMAVQRIGLRHAEILAPAISTLLDQADLPASQIGLVVCSIGPGSFTGVRIGLSTAKGLALGAGCPVVGIPSLDALAYRLSFFEGVVVPLIDARKGRVYAATYAAGKRTSEYLDADPDSLAATLLRGSLGGRLLLTGPYAGRLRASLERAASALPGAPACAFDPGFVDTDPAALLELGVSRWKTNGADPEGLSPLYLRPSEAELRVGQTPRGGLD